MAKRSSPLKVSFEAKRTHLFKITANLGAKKSSFWCKAPIRAFSFASLNNFNRNANLSRRKSSCAFSTLFLKQARRRPPKSCRLGHRRREHKSRLLVLQIEPARRAPRRERRRLCAERTLLQAGRLAREQRRILRRVFLLNRVSRLRFLLDSFRATEPDNEETLARFQRHLLELYD
jgi:hypothetical protein